MHVADWLPTVIEVLAIVAGLTVYILHWSVRGRLRRIRCARMILAELNILSRMAKPYGDAEGGAGPVSAIDDSTEILPHNAYDGLVNSASISYLDQPLQEQLHSFYELVIAHNYNQEPGHMVMRGGLLGPTDGDGGPRQIKPELETITASVREFLRKNERDRRWLLKLFRAYDGDG